MNNKKFLSLVLSLVMVLGTFTSVFAASTTDKKDEKTTETKVEKVEKIVGKDNKIQYIIDKKFVEGYEDGDYGYDKNIKRSEITKLLVFANGHKELSEKLQGSMKVYSDVDTAFWANGVITVGTTVPSSSNNQAMLNGYPTGKFLPERNVTYAELAKMLVVLAKEDLTADMVKTANANWAAQWMTWAAELGILDDVTVANSDAFATRADAFTMLYNALYKMQSFKREAANDKIGILSKLDGKTLTLNQDSEEEYKITDDTVFVKHEVNGKKVNDNDNVIKVSTIKNPEYYKGSLVRIMYNDKKEITHILELGNPEKGALYNNKDKADELGYNGEVVQVKDNSRWNEVADATVSTKMYNLKSLKDNKKEFANEDMYFNDLDNANHRNAIKSYAELNFDGSDRTDIDNITLVYVEEKADKKDGKVRLNKELSFEIDEDDTKVYIANPGNNQMKEVKDIYEAIRLLGYKEDTLNKIPNVYVGYDDDSTKTAIGEVGKDSKAKVIVFNIVTKENDLSERYRVINETSSKGVAVLEDVNGKKYERDDFKNTNRFPFDSFNLNDVVEYTYDAVDESYDWEVIIDSEETEDDYPIVKVTDKKDDLIVVEDHKGRKTILNTDGADIFGGKIEKDDVIQFVVDKDNRNEVDAISILKKAPKLEGRLTDGKDGNVGYYLNEYDRIVNIDKVEDKPSKDDKYKVSYTYYEELLSKRNGDDDTVYVTEDEAKVLRQHLNEDLVLRFKDNDDFDELSKVFKLSVDKKGNAELTPVEFKETEKEKLEAELKDAKIALVDAQKAATDASEKLTADKDEAKKADEALKALDDSATDAEKAAAQKALDDANAAVTASETKLAEANTKLAEAKEKVKEIEDKIEELNK